MTKDQTKNYRLALKQVKSVQLALKQIKSVMNQALNKLSAEEQKMVDKDIYYDSRVNGTGFDWEVNCKTSDFFMYYNDAEEMGAVKCFICMIHGKPTVMVYTYHNGQIEGDLASKSTFKGNLPAFIDILPECLLEKIIINKKEN